MTDTPFFSDDDSERMAYGMWLHDQRFGLTDRSWAAVEADYLEKATFVVAYMNQMVAA